MRGYGIVRGPNAFVAIAERSPSNRSVIVPCSQSRRCDGGATKKFRLVRLILLVLVASTKRYRVTNRRYVSTNFLLSGIHFSRISGQYRVYRNRRPIVAFRSSSLGFVSSKDCSRLGCIGLATKWLRIYQYHLLTKSAIT